MTVLNWQLVEKVVMKIFVVSHYLRLHRMESEERCRLHPLHYLH